MKDINGPVVFLRGLPATTNEIITNNKNISVFNHLPASGLNELIQRSKLVVARCGYSTIMDLVALNQKAILVPTPGQTEQEYLARYLKEKKLFFTVEQENFSLVQEIKKMQDFKFLPINIPSEINEKIIVDWLAQL
ncbi:MAG: glycosyltransferase [Ferruginibacter sp.]